MCGRYDLNESPQMLALYFLLSETPGSYSNADVRPTNTAPIIRVEEGRRVRALAKWGLIPSWSKDEQIAKHTFNARAETLAEKPSFRASFKRKRCLVPVSAFFEWQAIPGQKKKQKLRFGSPDGSPLALAGLWDVWMPPERLPIESYTIITTAANQLLEPIHERMPAVLGRSDWDAWLDPDTVNPLLFQSMLQPCPEEWLKCEVA